MTAHGVLAPFSYLLGLANDGRGFVGPKKKTIVGLLELNPLWFCPFLLYFRHKKLFLSLRHDFLYAPFLFDAVKFFFLSAL